MSTKATGIVAYLTFIGWIIAICAGDKEGAKVHLNNALVVFLSILLASIIMIIPIIGWIVGCVVYIAAIVFWVMGLIYAIQEQDKELPLIGQIKIIK